MAFLIGLVLSPLGLSAPVGALAGASSTARHTYNGFTNPQVVAIDGYTGTAMEPFISRDGQYLFFNSSNQSPAIPALQYATRINGQEFTYQGQIQGANEPGVLSGTPSMDDDATLYFISTRSYSQTLSTVYSGQFADGEVSDVQLVTGVSGGTPGIVDFDVEVTPDGTSLYVSVGQFGSDSAPENAHLSIFDKAGSTFVADPASSRILRAVNKKRALDYAASISTDGLEIFFTRVTPGGVPQIYRAVRTRVGQPFGHVQRVAAITGFAEAPSISADGTILYYHLLVGEQFDIERVTRPPAG